MQPPDQTVNAYVHDVVGHGILGMCHIDGNLIGGPQNSLMSGGPGVFSGDIADQLSMLDIDALQVVYGSGLNPGATGDDFIQEGLIDSPLPQPTPAPTPAPLPTPAPEPTTTPSPTPTPTPSPSPTPTPEEPPIRGDANQDGMATSADITCVILGIFGMSCPMPDCNDDGMVTSADITCVILEIFN